MDAEQVRQEVRHLEDLQVEYAADGQFNNKLLVWFHPHRGDKSAQRWLKRRLKKTFPRADFFMPRYLGQIDSEVITALAVELLLLVAAIHESARLQSRPYQEVVLVAYGEGILVTRKMLELSTDSRAYFDDPALDTLIRENWSDISASCRTVYIARGQAGSQLRQQLGHVAGEAGPWWRNLAARLAELVSR